MEVDRLMPGWCGSGVTMLLKSIRVGLDWVGAEWIPFWGEFRRVFTILGHFGPFLAHFGPILVREAPGEPQISMEDGRFSPPDGAGMAQQWV